MTFRLHPRTLPVNSARAQIGMAVSQFHGQEIRDTNDRLLALSEFQADLCRRLTGLRPLFGGSYPGLYRLLNDAQRAHELTDVEMLQIVAEKVLGYSRYVLREERFPGRPDARADMHPDDQDDEDEEEDDVDEPD